jgi:hypothetical protein
VERYLGKSLGYYGTNEEEAFAIAQVSEVLEELIRTYYSITKILDYEHRHQNAEKFLLKDLPRHLKLLNNYAKENGGDGFLVGDSTSLVDIKFFAFGESLGEQFAERFWGAVRNYDKLILIYSRIANSPEVAHLSRGPPTTVKTEL